jgi:hypothetical protein
MINTELPDWKAGAGKRQHFETPRSDVALISPILPKSFGFLPQANLPSCDADPAMLDL